MQATFKGGAANGKVFTAIQGSATKPINKDNALAGDTKFLGLGCDPVPAAGGDFIAVVERGVCDFQVTSDGSGTATPAGPSVPVDISAVFDGWGYTHMYRVNLDKGAKMQEVDFYAPPENQDPTYAENFGDMTVHEVATDPDKNLVYVSHYALGMRVLRYDDNGITEVGKFVEAGGCNYWGVEVHKFGGQTYILGSDRDRGLRIFKFNG